MPEDICQVPSDTSSTFFFREWK